MLPDPLYQVRVRKERYPKRNQICIAIRNNFIARFTRKALVDDQRPLVQRPEILGYLHHRIGNIVDRRERLSQMEIG